MELRIGFVLAIFAAFFIGNNTANQAEQARADFQPSRFCNKGYCQISCNAWFYSGDCWATKSYSQSYQYIKCTDTFKDCDVNDNCATPCLPHWISPDRKGMSHPKTSTSNQDVSNRCN